MGVLISDRAFVLNPDIFAPTSEKVAAVQAEAVAIKIEEFVPKNRPKPSCTCNIMGSGSYLVEHHQEKSIERSCYGLVNRRMRVQRKWSETRSIE
jgi:hypothetical protein